VPDGTEQVKAAAVVVMDASYVAGVLLFANWLLQTRLGRRALVGSPARRNALPPFAPLIPFAVWFLGSGLLQELAHQIIGPLEDWRAAFLDNVIYCLGAAITIGLMLLMARLTFARRLRGFGLRLRTIPRDLGFGTLDLLAVWPLVLGMIAVVMEIGRLLLGPKFEVPMHMELKLITESASLPLQVLVIFSAVVIAPAVEEMLFRGLVQTVFRSYLGRPWLAIALTSAMFAIVHANGTHWPALFILSMGLGYAYEKSGSLYRPIFMHALFNGITIVAALAESPPA
jgi:membrane protease YdiL (CAAX protease family)